MSSAFFQKSENNCFFELFLVFGRQTLHIVLEFNQREERTMSELVDKYKEEYDKDCEFDRITLLSKQETIASIANKWAYRVFQHKTKLEKLKEKRTDLFIDSEISLEDSNDPRLKKIRSDAGRERYISKTKTIRAIDREVAEEQRLVDFLEEILSNCKFILSKRLTDVVELLKVETFG